MKKKASLFVFISLLMILLMSMSACAGTTAPVQTSVPEQPTTTESAATTSAEPTEEETGFIDPGGKFTPIFAVEGSPDQATNKAMQSWFDELEKVSNGKFKVQAFYNASLLKHEAIGPAIKANQIQLASASCDYLLADTPWIGQSDSAYFYADRDHCARFWASEEAKTFMTRYRVQTGVRMLSYEVLGVRELWLRDMPLDKVPHNPEQMKGLNIRASGTPVMMAMINGMGANAVPITVSEALSSMLTGTVDGLDMPPNTGYTLKYYDAAKYLVLADEGMNVLFPVVNEEFFQSLSPEFQEYMIQSADKWMRWADEQTKQEIATALDQLEAKGMIIITDVDKDAFKASCLEYLANNPDVGKLWDSAFNDAVQKYR